MRAQLNPIKPKPMRISSWKRTKDISEIFFKKNSKLIVENIETLSHNAKMEETFSPSHDMVEDLGNGGNLLGEQDSLVETRTVIEESRLVQLLENAYKMRTQHQFLRDHQPRLKTKSWF